MRRVVVAWLVIWGFVLFTLVFLVLSVDRIASEPRWTPQTVAPATPASIEP